MTAQATRPERKRKVNVSKALVDVVERGLTLQEAGNNQNVTKQAIHYAIKDLIPPPEVATYAKNRVGLIQTAQMKSLIAYNSLDEEETKEMIKRRGMVDFGIMYDKERLETGQSTGNIAVLVDHIESLQRNVGVSLGVSTKDNDKEVV
jgi:hypothetical protein